MKKIPPSSQSWVHCVKFGKDIGHKLALCKFILDFLQTAAIWNDAATKVGLLGVEKSVKISCFLGYTLWNLLEWSVKCLGKFIKFSLGSNVRFTFRGATEQARTLGVWKSTAANIRPLTIVRQLTKLRKCSYNGVFNTEQWHREAERLAYRQQSWHHSHWLRSVRFPRVYRRQQSTQQQSSYRRDRNDVLSTNIPFNYILMFYCDICKVSLKYFLFTTL